MRISRRRIPLTFGLAACVLALVAVPAGAAKYRFGVVFPAHSEGGSGFVDKSGNVRWAGLRHPPGNGIGGQRFVWRSRSARGTLSRIVELPSSFATNDVNANGAGVAGYNLGRPIGVLAVRRTPSGRNAFAPRKISAEGPPAFFSDAEIDDQANSVVSFIQSGGAHVRRMSGRGNLGPDELVTNVGGNNVLAVAPSGWAAIAYIETRNVAGQITSDVKVKAAGPTGRFGSARTVTTVSIPPDPTGGTDSFAVGPRQLNAAISSTGTVVVSYVAGGRFADAAETNFVQGTVYASTARPGEEFAAPQNLSSGGRGATDDTVPRIAFSRAGEAILVFDESQNQGGFPDQIVAAVAPRGTEFAPSQTIEQRLGSSRPQVAYDTRGTAVIAWDRRPQSGAGPTSGPAATARPAGGSFEAPRQLATNIGVNLLNVSGGGAGTSVITWTGYRGPSLASGRVETSIRQPG